MPPLRRSCARWTRETDVAHWAAERGLTDPKLLDFHGYAAAYFDARNRKSTPESLGWFAYTEEEIARMTEYIVGLNRAYFTGNLREAEALDPTGEITALFNRFPSLYTAYLISIRPDFGRNYRRWNNYGNNIT